MCRFLAWTFVWLAVLIGFRPALAKDRPLATENVFLIVSDGFRWQEVFNGAEEALLSKTNGGVKNVSGLRTNFWRATPEGRRQALLPFFWGEIAQHGQLYGNQAKGSVATVTNGRKFSFPGYNEMLTGAPDPRIDSNDLKPNPNVTVFEWLQEQPRFKNKTVAFGTWNAFPYIFNHTRSGIAVWPAWDSRFEDRVIQPAPALLDLLADTTPIFEDMILDSFLFRASLEHVRQHKPRLVFIGYGETDEWAHAGRYDLYLESAHNVDRFVHALWETVQSIPQYRNRTTFIITADHGRGSGLTGWKDHGEKVQGAEGIWLAVIGPDTPAAGERFQVEPITQSQIAATIAALLGADYREAFPQAGAPIPGLFPYRGKLASSARPD